MTPKSELGSETARMVKKSMDRQTFSATYRSDARRNRMIVGARIRSLHKQVEDRDGGIGALMGEIPVEILLLDPDLALETVRPQGPLSLPAMKCIGHFGICRIG